MACWRRDWAAAYLVKSGVEAAGEGVALSVSSRVVMSCWKWRAWVGIETSVEVSDGIDGVCVFMPRD